MQRGLVQFVQRGSVRRLDGHDVPVVIHPGQRLPGEVPETLDVRAGRVVLVVVELCQLLLVAVVHGRHPVDLEPRVAVLHLQAAAALVAVLGA